MKTAGLSRRSFLKAMGITLTAGSFNSRVFAAKEELPNVVLIYADDLGYGDVGCYGATAVKTPNIDKIASEGIRFTNAHSPAATCTPSRYAMLTGEYSFRKKGTGIASGNANMIIKPGRTTLPSIMQKAGYNTAVVGKWHLGLGEGKIDWNKEVKPNPNDIGFDYHFLIPATGDRVPCVYLEEGKVVGLDPKDPIKVSYRGPIDKDEPTGKSNPELLKMKWSHGHNATIVNGISRIGHMSGGKAARWVDEDMADVITEKACEYIEKHKDGRFFLYFSTHDIHVPRVPHQRFVGKTDMGPRGDAIVQLDWCTGEILKKLEKLGLKDNTMIIFTSDNGPVLDDGYKDYSVKRLGDHKPKNELRGWKATIYEGGTRVPFIVSWPEKIKAGKSDALACQIDLMASFANMTGQKLAYEDGPDSFDILDALLGKSKKGRDHLVGHSRYLSLIKGDWKYIEPDTRQWRKGKKGSKDQLYNLKEDIIEKNDLSKKRPDKLKEMREFLAKIKTNGRSRP